MVMEQRQRQKSSHTAADGVVAETLPVGLVDGLGEAGASRRVDYEGDSVFLIRELSLPREASCVC